MCGFAGILHYEREAPVSREQLERMLGLIRHRGPDSDGFHVEPGLGFAFARLAIIDPEGGDQPFTNDAQDVWVVFNGEIYNFRELRAELESQGAVFRTHSDTEVIVRAYERWGEPFVERLRGMFAIALWDRRERKLLLLRDRSGIKPLHVTFTPAGIEFASEAKALLARNGLDLLGYIGDGEVDADLERTAFRGVQQLGAGCLMRVVDGSATIKRYWRYSPSREESRERRQDVVAQFRERVDDAVRSHLVSDVPVASSLSGGIDSSAVTAAIVHAGRRDIMTFTVAFAGDASGDVASSQKVAPALGVANTLVPCAFDRSTVDQLPFIAWSAEGEFDLGFVARFTLARVVREHGAKVLLTGQGIDEILTGYHPSYDGFRQSALVRRSSSRLMASYRGLPPFGAETLEQLGAESDGGWSAISAAQLRADHARLSSGMLRFEDRMAMAAGVEVRVPLLDHHLLELCATFSEEERRAWFSAKGILRRAFAADLPLEIVERPKVGFNVSSKPLTQLLHETNSDLLDLTSDATVASKGYFDRATCEHLRRRNEFTRLDHVFIVHLLDELFVTGAIESPGKPA